MARSSAQLRAIFAALRKSNPNWFAGAGKGNRRRTPQETVRRRKMGLSLRFPSRASKAVAVSGLKIKGVKFSPKRGYASTDWPKHLK